ncbi:MAG: site-specific integrase [Bacteroidales bacterium]|nr:site-specific integrase [Bacteroidales bacterium]
MASIKVKFIPSVTIDNGVTGINTAIRKDMRRLVRIIHTLNGRQSGFSTDDMSELYQCECTLFQYMDKTIDQLSQRRQIRTAETYRSTLSSFKKFRQGEDVMLDAVTPELIETYQAYLKKRGNTPNTISFYMRILRAIYNRAVEDGITCNRHPFKHAYTGIDKTVKRALPLSTMRKIKALDLSRRPLLDFARDMFLMSFYLRGMSFIDMAFLKKSDLTDSHITYRRHKTGHMLTIAWTKEMQIIIDKYPANPTHYLLPILTKAYCNERQAYRNMTCKINSHLKNLGAMIGLQSPLTMYCARHTWASVAKTRGIPLSIISEGMGHCSEATTRIYLSTLSTSVIDRANAMIMRCL